MVINIKRVKARRRLIPMEQSKKMQLISDGALAIIAKYKAMEAARAPAPKPPRIQPRKKPGE